MNNYDEIKSLEFTKVPRTTDFSIGGWLKESKLCNRPHSYRVITLVHKYV